MNVDLAPIARADALCALRQRIVGIDRAVPLLDGTTVAYTNLDNAASTPVLAEVLQTVNEFMQWYSSVHRGTGFKSRVATQAYEDARRIVGGFVGADERDHVVIFAKNTTEAINKLAARLRLQPDDVVLVSALEHHSNDLPWRATPARVLHVGCDALGRLDEAQVERLLREHAGRVRLLAVTGGSNVTGTLPDVHRLAVHAHAAGAQIFVDCAQLAPHRPIRIGALDDPAHLDYVALSAHKMHAPFGSGALIGRRDTFERGAPEQRGGGTVEFVSLDDVQWAPAPEDRDEAGTPNVVGAVAMAAAVQALQRIGMAAIAAHESALTYHALQRFARVDGLQVYGDADPAHAAERLGVITFNLEGLSHAYVAAVLSSEFGIGVRNGCFCAHPYLMQLLGLSPAEVQDLRADLAAGDRRAMPGMVRVSFGCYNTFEEVDRVADALERIARGDVRGDYLQDRASGEYAARGFAPDTAACFSLLRRAAAQPPSRAARDATAPRAAALDQATTMMP
jgi:selenocysteine lyase/cysteine desulfurase